MARNPATSRSRTPIPPHPQADLGFASLNPCFPLSRPKPNSENRASSAPVKPFRNSNLHFSNSEPIELRHPASAPTSRHSPVAIHQLLLETPNRVETHVSHRKQTTGHASTRDASLLLTSAGKAESGRSAGGAIHRARTPTKPSRVNWPCPLRFLIGTRIRIESGLSHCISAT